MGENQRLRSELQAKSKSHDDMKELNLRLGHEIKKARREEVGSAAKVKWMEEEVQRMRQKCHSLSRELRAAKRKSPQSDSLHDRNAEREVAGSCVGEPQLQPLSA